MRDFSMLDRWIEKFEDIISHSHEDFESKDSDFAKGGKFTNYHRRKLEVATDDFLVKSLADVKQKASKREGPFMPRYTRNLIKYCLHAVHCRLYNALSKKNGYHTADMINSINNIITIHSINSINSINKVHVKSGRREGVARSSPSSYVNISHQPSATYRLPSPPRYSEDLVYSCYDLTLA